MTSRLSNTVRIRRLLEEANLIGNARYPFLSAHYSVNSRTPCMDFTPFVEECLRQEDLESIGQLIEGIVEANPGIVVGLGSRGGHSETGIETWLGSSSITWFRESIREVLAIDFSRYIQFDESRAFDRLRAMFMIASKEGGGREFWITDETPRLFAWSLASFLPRFRRQFAPLARTANRFISEKRVDVPYWRSYPKFNQSEVFIQPAVLPSVAESIRNLSAGASMQLVYAIHRDGGVLPELTDYPIRSFGIHTPATSREILSAALLRITRDPDRILKNVHKADLIQACHNASIHTKSKWTKGDLVSILAKRAPHQMQLLAEQHQIVEIPGSLRQDLLEFKEYANSLVVPFKILCFAGAS